MSYPYGVLFPASVVGSLPRPGFVRDLLEDRSLTPEESQTRMDAAVRYAAAMQEQAGLDVVTDGEWRRRSYIGVIADMAHGFELGVASDGRPWTVVAEPISPKNPGVVAREVSFLRSITSRMIKATLPAPALLGERLWDRNRSSRAYPRREDFVLDCVPILREELSLLRDAGANIVQIDDPHLCLFVDPVVRSQYENADAAADFAVEMINAMADGFDGLKIAVHLCRRAGARARGEACYGGGYERIIPQLNRLKVHHLTLEFTTPQAGDFEVLRKLREDFEIGLGCVSTEPGRVDSASDIRERVQKALKHVAPERITLNPDCGFAPGSAAQVSLEEVYQKLKNEAQAARELRGA